MIEQKYTTTFKRFGAAIIDAIVFLPLLLIQQWHFKANESQTFYISWLTFSYLIQILYIIILHYKYGQTIGKWVTGIKVKDVSESKNITLNQSILRTLCFSFVEIAGLFYLLYKILNQQKYSMEDYENVLSISVLAWTSLEIIIMLSNNKRRSLHDFFAKSVVIKL